MSNKVVHVISHTHWDREWYFSTCDSLVLMDQTITEILKELVANKNVNFCFDGQISIIEEYLQIHPEMKDPMQSLIDEKRLFVGPWYTQTDTQLVSMTSIINNLYYGIFDTKKLFGTYMNIGYLPDTFGFSNQIPMLLKQFQIDDFIFWRGVDFDKQKISPYFIWKGQDGSEVTAANLPWGYAMAQGLNGSKKFIDRIYKPMIEEYETLTDAKDIMITVGGDQQTIVRNLDQEIKKIPGNLKISNYSDFMKVIKNQTKGKYQGEFREGKYSRVHKSAGSIRAGIKASNYQAEISLAQELEPLNVMASEEGFGASPNLIKKAWKLLFEGQAHDGIVGCVNDSVAEDLLNRNKKVCEISQAAQNLMKKQFAWSVGLKENEIILFHTIPHDFYGYKTVEVISHEEAVEIEGVDECILLESKKHIGCPEALVETPNGKFYEKEKDYYFHKLLIKVRMTGMGYKVLRFHKVEKQKSSYTGQTIKNKYFQIEFQKGQLNLSYRDHEISDFISLTDMGNDGDTYDFSPLPDDKEIRLQMKEAKVRKEGSMQKMEIDCTADLPYDLKDRGKQGHKVACPCTLTVMLLDDAMIYVSIDFDNKVLSHRLRLKVKSYQGEKQTIAATPGGTIVRDVYQGMVDPSWNQTHVEYPVDIETNSGFTGFFSEKEQLVIWNKGIKEYQAVGDSIYMTLFSSCGELGKPNLMYRPGRASGDTTKKGHVRILTPMAQEIRSHHYELAISFLKPEAQSMYLRLQELETPNIFYQLQDINLFYERIDNKIQEINQNPKKLPKEKTYSRLPTDFYIYNSYRSVYDNNWYTRFMSFVDYKKKDIFDDHIMITNLLEQTNGDMIKALRIYTVKGDKYDKNE